MLIRRCWHCSQSFVADRVSRRFCMASHWRAWCDDGKPAPPWMLPKPIERKLIPGVDKEAGSASWRGRQNRINFKGCSNCGEAGHNARTCNKTADPVE